MQIKFQKSLLDFKYLVMFDLASKITGVCVWDLNQCKPINVQVLKTSNNYELQVADLYHLLKNYFAFLSKKLNINLDDVLVYKEAMPTQLHGGSSTIQTFIALARSHAILEKLEQEDNTEYKLFPKENATLFETLKPSFASNESDDLQEILKSLVTANTFRICLKWTSKEKKEKWVNIIYNWFMSILTLGRVIDKWESELKTNHHIIKSHYDEYDTSNTSFCEFNAVML